MSLNRLPATLSILALSTSAAAPLNQHPEALFPWWESLIILLLMILLVAVLMIWNARQPLEYAEALSHAHSEEHAHSDPDQAQASADDLAIIEGIGPKIKSIFAQAGITTFAQLADSDPAHLESLLRQAGLRLGDPTTWPEQARLAEDGDWAGLQRLQDSLKAGRRV
ncbi:MAG TPA: hypothetical protein VLA49_12325 [Anaerolineales bacterium]|nr:hypothetical protein [Anaerolineales bacterium]